MSDLTIERDAQGRTVRDTYATGASTTYTYHPNGKEHTMHYAHPDGRTASSVKNEDGNFIEITNTYPVTCTSTMRFDGKTLVGETLWHSTTYSGHTA